MKNMNGGRPPLRPGGLSVQLPFCITPDMWAGIKDQIAGQDKRAAYAWIREVIDARLEAAARSGPGVHRYIVVAIPETVYPFLKNAAIQNNGMSDARFVRHCVEETLRPACANSI